MVGARLKVAFVDYVLEPDKPGRSGLSDIVWDMASALIDQGHEAHVVASYNTTAYPDKRVVVHNFKAPPMGYRNVVGNAWLLKRASTIVKRLEPDIVHAPEYVSTALFAAYGVSQPIVLTVPGNIYHRLKENNPVEWYYAQILKWAAKASARNCASVIAISKEMKCWWERTGSPPDHTPWIPLGVDPERFRPVPDARAKLGIPKDQLFLLYVGRFSEEKGLRHLLDAIAQANSQFRLARLRVTLIGSGRLERELLERIRRDDLGAILDLQPWVEQEELKLWYSAADALVLPSRNEPLGRVMCEALSCGTPVIATASEGPRDHIQDGTNGYLLPLGDVTALEDVIRTVLSEPETLAGMRPTALSYAQQNLAWPGIVGRIVQEVYYPAIAQRDRHNATARHV